jgi:hypothetical protein
MDSVTVANMYLQIEAICNQMIFVSPTRVCLLHHHLHVLYTHPIIGQQEAELLATCLPASLPGPARAGALRSDGTPMRQYSLQWA